MTDHTPEQIAAIAEGLDAFLASYKGDDWRLNLFGPVVHRRPRRFWQKGWHADREMQARLERFGLPRLTNQGRALWHIMPGQQFNEDAGGALRRKWMLALGVSLPAYRTHLEKTNEAK